jgi:hypothetical protein
VRAGPLAQAFDDADERTAGRAPSRTLRVRRLARFYDTRKRKRKRRGAPKRGAAKKKGPRRRRAPTQLTLPLAGAPGGEGEEEG